MIKLGLKIVFISNSIFYPVKQNVKDMMRLVILNFGFDIIHKKFTLTSTLVQCENAKYLL